jgi:uncharacterized protein YraI
MLKTIIFSSFFVAFAFPVNAQVGPGLGSSDRIASEPENYAQVCTKSANGRLTLRMGPGQEFNKVKEIANGQMLALNGGKYGRDGFWWWNVYHNNSRGWVRSDYVCGDPQ